jgi:outer membrane protein assembly factor BamB
MTDAEWIRKLEEDGLEGLTAEDLTALRDRAARSPELLRRLRNELRFESALHQLLARVDLPVGGVLAAADRSAAARRWALGLLALVFAAAASALVASRFRGEGEPPAAAKDARDASSATAAARAPASGVSSLPPIDASTAPAAGGAPAELVLAPEAEVERSSSAAERGPAASSARAVPERPFASSWFTDFERPAAAGAASLWPRRAEVERWLAPLEGSPAPAAEEKGRPRRTRIAGVYRLAPSWTEDSALRIAIAAEKVFKLHFFSGTDGISLHFHPSPSSWTAYRARRRGTGPAAYALAYAGADDGRFRRSGAGTFELRVQNGKLILSRGDSAILAIATPFRGPPAEVFAEGEARIRGIELYRGGPFPLAAPHAGAVEARPPASMEWTASLSSGAAFVDDQAGGVVLSAGASGEESRARCALRPAALGELVAEIEPRGPGAGIALVGARGESIARVGFRADREPGRLALAALAPDGAPIEPGVDVDAAAAPLVDGAAWLKLVVAGKSARVWLGADGVSWGEALPPLPLAGGTTVAALELFCGRGAAESSIALKRLELRPLAALAGLADAALWQRALALGGARDWPSWREVALESRPQEADVQAWLQTCAAAALAQGTSVPLHNELVEFLFDEALPRARARGELLELLRSAAVIFDVAEPGALRRLLALYERAADALERAGAGGAATVLSGALLEAPIGAGPGGSRPDADILPEALVRRELLERIHGGDWGGVRELCRRCRFFSSPRAADGGAGGRAGVLQLAAWAEDFLEQRRSGGAGLVEPAALPGRHPFLPQVDKPAYNAMAEFRASLASGAYRDACQALVSSAGVDGLSLVPDVADPELLQSFEQAVELALRDDPRLRRAFEDSFGRLGSQHARQAIEDQDAAAVAAVASRFPGIAAAAEARGWLGDRALSIGEFGVALEHYRRALEGAAGDRRAALEARRRLAGALAGVSEGAPIASAVALAGPPMAAADFEALVASRLASRQGGDGPERRSRFALGPGEVAGASMRALAEFEPAVDPQPRDAPAPAFDWLGRVLSVAEDAGLLMVSDGQRLAAIEAESGRTRWRFQRQGGRSRAQRRSPTPMHPLAGGPRVIARLLSRDTPALYCLARDDGRLLWSGGPGEGALSDPLLAGGRILVLGARSRGGSALELALYSIDAASGKALSETAVASFADASDHEIDFQVAAAPERLIASGGGCVFRLAPDGAVAWLRRQVWMPPGRDSRAFLQSHPRPLVDGGRVFATQPGVRSVECLDADSGRLLWGRALPALERWLGLSGGCLLIQSGEELMALEAATGGLLWQRHAPEILGGLPAREGVFFLAAAEADASRPGPPRGSWRWIDARSGSDLGRVPWALELAASDGVAGGPVWTGESLILIASSAGRHERRLLARFVPAGREPRR